MQDDAAAIYAPKIDKAEAKIDWPQDAAEIERLVRGLAPFPGAWFELEGERVKLLLAEVAAGSGVPGTVLDDDFTIACGNGAIRPLRLQRAGKPVLDRAEFLRGRAVAAGTVLR
jgi:methionyl-tRNA formyltransferase